MCNNRDPDPKIILGKIRPQFNTKCSKQLERIIKSESKRISSLLTAANPYIIFKSWPLPPLDLVIAEFVLDYLRKTGYAVQELETSKRGKKKVVISLYQTGTFFEGKSNQDNSEDIVDQGFGIIKQLSDSKNQVAVVTDIPLVTLVDNSDQESPSQRCSEVMDNSNCGTTGFQMIEFFFCEKKLNGTSLKPGQPAGKESETETSVSKESPDPPLEIPTDTSEKSSEELPDPPVPILPGPLPKIITKETDEKDSSSMVEEKNLNTKELAVKVILLMTKLAKLAEQQHVSDQQMVEVLKALGLKTSETS